MAQFRSDFPFFRRELLGVMEKDRIAHVFNLDFDLDWGFDFNFHGEAVPRGFSA
jgi:hypothetical protein